VHRQINTFQLTEAQFGAIDSNGKWIVPLSAGNNFDGHLIHIGDGFVRIRKSNTHTGNITVLDLLNISTGEIVHGEIQSENHSAYNTTHYRPVGWTTVNNFENGYGVFSPYAFQNTNVYSTDTAGNTRLIIENVPSASAGREYVGEYREGLFYLISGGGRDAKTGFYDINGNLVIDLSEYTVVHSARGRMMVPAFSGGYCPLVLQNAQGAHFYTVIDKTGRFLFEPKPYPYSWDDKTFVTHDSGLIMLWQEVGSEHRSFKVTAVDTSGKTVFELSNLDSFRNRPNFQSGSQFNFHEGVAHVSVIIRNYEFDEYYIDKTGKRLF
jgi:hypothetical protein